MKKKKKILYICIFAFIVPFLIMGLAFVKLKIYPFGDQQVLIIDAWHQYYPFLVELNRKLKDGESLLYSWRIGLGSDFVSLAAYYLASPLNLLTVLVPENLLREAFALMILIKIGFAGSFCAYALYKMKQYGEEETENGTDADTMSERDGIGILIFSTFYALCGWVQGYYWNIMWLDSFAVFPLVVLGACQLVREKKYRLYTISLAAAILTNYYIGFMICIFTAFFFFAQCIMYQEGLKELWRNLKNIILFSLIAVMISGVFILPSFVALQNTYKGAGFTNNPVVTRGWIETISSMFAYLEPSHLGGRPYIYCGVLCLLYLFAFFRLPKVSKKEKMTYGGMVLLLFVSMNISILDYLWHGFHFTNSMPYRFSFMFTFLVVMMAYRVYVDMDMLKKKDLFLVGGAGISCYLLVAIDQVYQYGKDNGCVSVLEAFKAGGSNLREFLFKNLLIITAILVLLTLMAKKKLKRKWFTLLLMYVAGLELVSTVTIRNDMDWTTGRDNYPDKYAAVQEALADIEEREGTKSFYRTELTSRCVLNPAVLYHYRGVTLFSSLANAGVVNVFENMGLPYWDNGYYYQNATPVDNLFLNLKYLIARGEPEIANPEYLIKTAQVEDVFIYRNEAYLPIGFMVESGMADFQFEGNTPFEKQNNLLKTAAGVDGAVFEALDIIHVGHENVDVGRYDYGLYHYEPLEETGEIRKKKKEPENEKFKYNYEMPKDGSAYAFMELTAENTAMIEFNDEMKSYAIYRDGNFFPAGTYKEGDLFSICSEANAGESGDLRIFVSILNQDVFDQAYDLLKDETLEVTEWTSTYLKGNITVKKDNLMYTSIPYEKGWKVYVDGERAEITPIADAFIGVMLPEGEHTVEFKYSPGHVYFAVILSLMGIGIFVLVVVMDRKGKLKFI